MGDTLVSSLAPRPFAGLLNGLCRRNFYGETNFPNSVLLEELWGASEQDRPELILEIETFERVLLEAARRNWESGRLEEVLVAGALDTALIKSFVTFWTTEKEKVCLDFTKLSLWQDLFDFIGLFFSGHCIRFIL